MSPEAQRIAIAEACGVDCSGMDVCHCGDPIKNHTYEHSPVSWMSPNDLPDYLSDLNAMHDAWKTLTATQQFLMAEELYRIVDRESCNGEVSMSDVCGPIDVLQIVGNATAAQRAEAFLRTIGKFSP